MPHMQLQGLEQAAEEQLKVAVWALIEVIKIFSNHKE